MHNFRGRNNARAVKSSTVLIVFEDPKVRVVRLLESLRESHDNIHSTRADPVQFLPQDVAFSILWAWRRNWTQWGSIVSWRACSAESETAARVSRSRWGFFKWTKKLLANFYHWLKRITFWCVVSLTWWRIMAVHKCCTFHLKRKNLLSPTLTPAVRCWPWGVFSSWLASRDLRYSALQLLGESGACVPNLPA